MTSTGENRIDLVDMPAPDNGKESLWAIRESYGLRLLSVPIFALGVSRNAIVDAATVDGRLLFRKVITPSPGATIRCYVPPEMTASIVYERHVRPRLHAAGYQIGPCTLFDPEIVAIHVHERVHVKAVGHYLELLVGEGLLRFWELGDPTEVRADDSDGSVVGHSPSWTLSHPLPVDDTDSRIETN